MKIIPKTNYLINERYEYPIGYIVNFDNNSYQVIHNKSQIICEECSFELFSELCNKVRCSCMRKDGNSVVFKKIEK